MASWFLVGSISELKNVHDKIIHNCFVVLKRNISERKNVQYKIIHNCFVVPGKEPCVNLKMFTKNHTELFWDFSEGTVCELKNIH